MKSMKKCLAMLLSLAMVVVLLLGSTIFVFAEEIPPEGGEESTASEPEVITPASGDVFKYEDGYIVGSWETNEDTTVNIFVNYTLRGGSSIKYEAYPGTYTIEVYENGLLVYTQELEVPYSPNVTNITVSPKIVKPGDFVTVTIEVDEPDKFEAGHIGFMTKGEDQYFGIYYENGRLSGKLEITDAYKNATYNAISMQIENTDYTTKYLDDELSGFDTSFTVTESNEDTEPPTGEGSVDGDTFKPGDTIKVTANVKDNRRMGYVAGSAYQITDPDADPANLWAKYDGGDYHYIEMRLAGDGDPADGGQYEGSADVTNHWENGDYDIIIEGYDELGNHSILDTIRIAVKESLEDKKAPVVGSATVDRNEAKPGDVVHVIINDVKDLEGAEVTSVYAFLTIHTDDINMGYQVSLTPLEGIEGSYEGEIEVNDGFPNGEYVLEVDTWDSFENYGEYYFDDQTVTVSGSREDINPPQITSLTFDKSEYLPGESPIMTVTGSDDTEIADIEVYIVDENDEGFYATYGYHFSEAEAESNEDSSFTAKIKLQDDLEIGTYRTIFVSGRDVFGNYVRYDDEDDYYDPLGDLAQSFKVIEEDKENPQPKDYTITFDLDGGTLNGKTGTIVEKHKEGTIITIPAAPTQEGYEFDYWEGSEYYPGDKYEVKENHTFTAVWRFVEEEDTPSDTPTDKEEDTPSDTPSDKPTDTPSDTPSDKPTDTPSDTPSDKPTDTPSDTPSDKPTDTPSDTPSDKPTDTPSDTPTDKPTDTPSDTPTDKPTDTPSDTPTDKPTDTPSDTPTDTPTDQPTDKPSDKPSEGTINNGGSTSSGSKTDSSNQSVGDTSKTDSKSSDTSKATTGVPKTGDAETMMLWVVIISALAVTTIAMSRSRNARQ